MTAAYYKTMCDSRAKR